MNKEIKQSKKSKLISDTKKYAFSLYVTKFVSLPCGIITAKLLGPFLYGTWSAVKIVLSYTPSLQLGISSGIRREVPILKGQGKFDEITSIKESATNFIYLISLFLLICLFTSTFFLKNTFSPLIIVGLRVVAFIASFNLSTGLYINLLEAEGNFTIPIRIRIFRQIFTSIVQVALVLMFGLYGLYAATFLGAMLVFLYMRSTTDAKIKPLCIKLKVIKDLMKPGIPMLLNGMAHTLFYTTDRLLIVAMLGKKALGIYAIALLAGTFLEFIPRALFQVLLPNVMERVGEDKRVLEANKVWFDPAFILSNSMPILIGIVWIIAPMFVYYILPKYLAGIGALKALSVSVHFLALVGVYRIFFIGLNKHHIILFIYLALIAVNLGLNFFFIKQGMGILGVAIATVSSCFLLSNALLYYAVMHHKLSIYEKIKTYLIINVPIFYIIGLLLFFDKVWFSKGMFNLSAVVVELILFLLFSTPLLYQLNFKTQVVTRILRSKNPELLTS